LKAYSSPPLLPFSIPFPVHLYLLFLLPKFHIVNFHFLSLFDVFLYNLSAL
jgi:hypothetical protein